MRKNHQTYTAIKPLIKVKSDYKHDRRPLASPLINTFDQVKVQSVNPHLVLQPVVCIWIGERSMALASDVFFFLTRIPIDPASSARIV